MTHPLVGWPFLGSRQRRKVRSELFDVIGRMRLQPFHAPCMGSARKKGLSVGIPPRTGSGSTPMPAAPRLSVQERALPGVTSRLGVVTGSGQHEYHKQ
jgi:hypothetical protein